MTTLTVLEVKRYSAAFWTGEQEAHSRHYLPDISPWRSWFQRKIIKRETRLRLAMLRNGYNELKNSWESTDFARCLNFLQQLVLTIFWRRESIVLVCVAMDVGIPEARRRLLLKAPVFTPILIGVKACKQTALALRVDTLAPFRKPEFRIQVSLVFYRSTSECWLVSVPFCIWTSPLTRRRGNAYLNPRQVFDRPLLNNLTKQKTLLVFLFSSDLRDAAVKEIPWQEQAEAARALRAAHPSLADKLCRGWDHQFEAVRREFQNKFSVGDLLRLSSANIPVEFLAEPARRKLSA